MTNLAYKSIQTNGEYIDLAEEMGITLTQGTNYQIQILNSATVINYPTKPTVGGFYISNDEPFGYTHTGDTLWIKSLAYTPAVVNIAEGGSGGSSAVIEPLSVTPTTSQQVIDVETGTDGYAPVTVSAVTAAIDQNISAANIKKNVVILGITGSYEGSGGVGITREVSQTGVYQMPTSSFTFSLPSTATDVGDYAMQYSFNGCTGLTSVDLSNLTTVSGRYAMYYAFYGCTGLTSVDLSNLTTVSGRYGLSDAFNGCTGLTSVDLSSLTTVSSENGMNQIFNGCTSLMNVDLSSLTTVSSTSGLYGSIRNSGCTSIDLSNLTTVSGSNSMGYALYYCTSLMSVDLSKLSDVSGSQSFMNAFGFCTSLTTLSFPSLTSTSFGSYTNQFNRMLNGVTGCTVHFPSNLQSVIGNWSDVTAGFGGTNTTVLFDLPATT